MSDNLIGWSVNIISVVVSFILVASGLSPLAITTLAVLMVLDFFFGIRRSIANGECVTSKRMRIGLQSKALTLILLLTIAILGREIAPAQKWFSGEEIAMFLVFLFATNELCSIGDNMREISDQQAKRYSRFHAISFICGLMQLGLSKIGVEVDDKIVELLENNLARIEKLAGEAKTKAVK